MNDPLPVNEQDLCHENIDLVNTFLFSQVYMTHDIVCFEDQPANVHLTFLPKTGVLIKFLLKIW